MDQNIYYDVVPAQEVMTGTNTFKGHINFKYNTPTNLAHQDLQMSHFVIQGIFTLPNFNITGVSNAANVNMGFTSNPAAALFKSITYNINDRLIQKISEYSCYSTTDKILNSNHLKELCSGSPFLLNEGKKELFLKENMGPLLAFAGVAGDAIVPAINLNTCVQTDDIYNIRKRNALIINYTGDAFTEFNFDYFAPLVNDKISFRINIPYMFLNRDILEDNVFYGNLKHHINFQVNSDLFDDMFVGNPDKTGYALEVKRFEWVIPTFKTPEPKNISTIIDYVETFEQKTNHTTNNYSIEIPSNTHLCCVYFTRKNGMYPATDTIKPLSFVEADLKTISIKYNGETFPRIPYNFQKTELNDAGRAYEDYLRFSRSMQTNTYALIDNFNKFKKNAFFVFDTNNAINNTAGNTTLNIKIEQITAGAYPANVDINVVCYYNKRLSIFYGNEAQVTKIDLNIAA